MERFVCIHGHFYQPPRENPSLEAIELQDSAYPYHDWNERITAECYGPNGTSRILDGDGRIVRIVNNYAGISFNFGPTLLQWMEDSAPEVYASILAADRESQERFSGHGSALAQSYNHTILPLSTSRDKSTQVLWGIRDFQHRFGRYPEGMWLPETAVDLESLDILAGCGIRFTLLAQYQASRVRRIGGRNWADVSGGKIDPTRPYMVRLPSGRKIAVFFYDGPISRAVAFEKLLERGEYLAGRLMSAFSDQRSWPQIVHIATDGETYGHHHRNGDMALAYALHHIESNNLARLTNYGEFLERFPPTHEVEIFENTAWSCAHGVGRWQADCGCNSGGYPGWTQGWRGPLRDALNWLRDAIGPEYDRHGRPLLKDPWAARDDYVGVVLDRSRLSVDRFFARHATRELDEQERTRALKLLEIQRNAMLMYTSCGWFFDELSGIETVQVIQYAGRAIQLAEEVMEESFEPQFVELLEQVKSNVPEHRDGRSIYEKWVKPSLVGLRQVGAHFAISSLFEEYEDSTRVYCYTVDQEDYRQLATGRVRLALGRARVQSEITREAERVDFGVLHLGDHNLSGGVQPHRSAEEYGEMVKEMSTAFSRADLTELIRVVDRYFGTATYTLKLLFRDQQRKILGTILDTTLRDAQLLYRQVYDSYLPLMRFLTDLGVPLPSNWVAAAEVVINAGLRDAFEAEDLDSDAISGLLAEARSWQVRLDAAGLAYVLKRALGRAGESFAESPGDLEALSRFARVVDVAVAVPFEVDFFKAQNVYYAVLQTMSSGSSLVLHMTEEAAREWLDSFVSLGEKLGVRVEEMKARLTSHTPSVATMAEDVASGRRVPLATYRLQLNRDFTFADARSLVPYLHRLGLSDIYASPLFRARSDSAHGYDICAHDQINPALGGEEEFTTLARALRDAQMGLVLDMVPNHMGIGETCNTWWMDVLENGPSSIYSSYFDIDWQPMKPELSNKVLLPILEDQYGKVLEQGKLRLSYEEGAFFIHHYETKLPVAPRTYRDILSYQLNTVTHALGEDHEHVQELQSILTALTHLPTQTELDPDKVAERNREKEIIKRRLATLYQSSRYVRAAIDTAVEVFNGTPGDPASLDLLDHLLAQQAYRPAFWRVAAEEINYRRFFDINDLAAIRVELPDVFIATHRLVMQLLARGDITGLRIDHPDGLWNPGRYFRRLQEAYLVRRIGEGLGHGEMDAGLEEPVAAWVRTRIAENGNGLAPMPLYVLAEKILSEEEALPDDWPIDGTTGYDFLNALNGIFVDGRNERAFDRLYAGFVGSGIDYKNLINSTKKMIMLVSLASEINALARQLERISEKNRLYRDFTLNSLTFVLREVMAALPVYRTYITSSEDVGLRDVRYVEIAVAEAKRRNPRTAEAVFDFIRDTLLLRNLEDFRVGDRQALVDFVMKFQQVTGPVMAKGVEDTAFYVYNRLVSLNEVGGHPDVFGVSLADFHSRSAERLKRWRHSMLSTSTHDTKRSEDVRARINVLSEMPGEWKRAIERWAEMNEPKKTPLGGGAAPDRNDEYLLYQALLGAWPDTQHEGASLLAEEEFETFRARIGEYMRKATKEAKVHTSWVNANEEYDNAVQSFVQKVLVADAADPFIQDFLGLQRTVGYFGRWNSLSQLVLKLTSPGVPDLYQGCEMWDFSLVDPDNRRPVDYSLRASVLADLQVALERRGAAELSGHLLKASRDGRIKQYTTWRALDLRRRQPHLFLEGDYQPLPIRGAKKEHVCAFIRRSAEAEIVVAVPRLVFGLCGGTERSPVGQEVWQDTILALPRQQAGTRYRNIFTGEVVGVVEQGGAWGAPLADALATFPVAVLERV
jgi:(1->4)-alpha-D-glucan 1-alpha-D-glucosylmutase